MGITDTLIEIGTDLAENLVADKIGEGLDYLIKLALGDKKDDDDKQAVARAAMEGAKAALEVRIKNKVAAEQLPEKLNEMYRACAKVLDAFVVKGTVDLGLNAEVVVALTAVSWELLTGAEDVIIGSPNSAEIETFGALGRVHVEYDPKSYLVIPDGETDREVPPSMQAVIDREWRDSTSDIGEPSPRDFDPDPSTL